MHCFIMTFKNIIELEASVNISYFIFARKKSNTKGMLINYAVSLYRKVYVQNYLLYSLKYLLFRVSPEPCLYATSRDS